MEQQAAKRRKVSSSEPPANSEGRHRQSIEEGQSNTAKPAAKGSRKHAKAPSSFSADAYGKDIVQMQTDDLLDSLDATRRRRSAAATPFLDMIRAAINDTPDEKSVSPSAGERMLWKKAKVTVPYPDPQPEKDVQFKVAFQRPTNIAIVGSFALDTALVRKSHVPTIDLAVTMPKVLFEEKDYLTNRYFHKRAFYLACLAAHLTQTLQGKLTVNYRLLHDNPLQPVLMLHPSGDPGRKFSIRILLAIDQSLFPPRKTLPLSNSIRASLDVNNQTDTHAYLQVYNGSLRHDASVACFSRLLERCADQVPGFSRACTLFAVWLSQRGLQGSLSAGGFGSFEASILMALLLNGSGDFSRPVLSSGYNSLQLLKATLQLIRNRDFGNDPLCIASKSGASSCPDFLAGSPTLWDETSSTNVFYKMTSSSYSRLQHHARCSLQALKMINTDIFGHLFMTDLTDETRLFDDWLVISTDSQLFRSQKDDPLALVSNLEQNIFGVLNKALTDRITMIDVRIKTKNSETRVSQKPALQIDEARVGFLLRAEHYQRMVDRGPSAEDKQAAANFRKFWSSKAELRRFQDGSILESVVWQEGGEPVYRQIIEYICSLRLHIDILFIGSEPFAADSTPEYAANARERLNSSWQAFEKLYGRLKDLNKLPLQIRQLQPAGWAPADGFAFTGERDLLELNLQFEGSANWPEDVAAIQVTKIALLSRLIELLEQDDETSTYELRREDPGSFLVGSVSLDVLPKGSRTALRIRIQHDRELELLAAKLEKASSAAERHGTSEAIATLNRRYTHGPTHLQALRRLGLLYPLLLPSVMLFNQWCASHLLSSHLSFELISLLVMHIFTASGSFVAPSNAQTALLRILDFIANWDWREEPLVVDSDQDLTASHFKDAVLRFQAWRKIDPQLNKVALFVASGSSVDGTVWTQHDPSKAIFARLAAIARAAAAQMHLPSTVEFSQATPLNLRTIFAPGLSDFDFVVHLKQTSSSGAGHGMSLSNGNGNVFKNLQLASIDQTARDKQYALSAVDMFAREAAALHSGSVVLFYSGNGAGSAAPVLAGMWTPAGAARTWKAGLEFSTEPVLAAAGKGGKEEEAEAEAGKVDSNPVTTKRRNGSLQGQDQGQVQVQANRRAILHDIVRLGGDLVDRVEVKDL